MSMFTLANSCLTTCNYSDSWTEHPRFLCNIVLYSIGCYFHHHSQAQLGVVFAWTPSLLDQGGGVEGCVLIFSCENSQITTSCWTTIDKRMLDPTEKRPPMPKGKGESPTRWWEGWNHIQDQTPYPPGTLRGLKQYLACAKRPHSDLTRPDFECLSVSSGGLGQQWPVAEAGALGAAELGMT